MLGQILLTTLISSLLLVVEHYWPWKAIIKKPIDKIFAYILGVLAIHIPLTWLLLIWGFFPAVYALWSITVVGGAVVAGINLLDNHLETRSRMEISEREAELRRRNDGATNR
ncbi:MAG TPA: hypothetical protein VJL34_13930 [Anaerolineales bacterium]|nr:hypothetical protein [Anaerolineales bacterium]